MNPDVIGHGGGEVRWTAEELAALDLEIGNAYNIVFNWLDCDTLDFPTAHLLSKLMNHLGTARHILKGDEID